VTPVPLKRQAILPRIDGIQRDVEKLRTLGELPPDLFANEDNFIKAQFYLRRALERMFHIGSHVLSRLPGGRPTEYKEIAIKLGELGIVDKDFAKGPLKQIAGYRNRLTHFYADIIPSELHTVVRDRLEDIDRFLHSIRTLMEHPEGYHLTVE
jgi:uncharacterized protein YutE (UPF0331/DUF86 family)